MKYLEVPESRVRDDTGQTWLRTAGGDEGPGSSIWLPVPFRVVELPRVDPVTQVIASRAALAILLNYAHHSPVGSRDPQFADALRILAMELNR